MREAQYQRRYKCRPRVPPIGVPLVSRVRQGQNSRFPKGKALWVDVDAGEDDVLVYLGKRDKKEWLRPRKQGKNDMADTLWLGKSLKALASRTAEAIIENLPVEAGQTATTDRTIEIWLRSFFGDLVDLHTEKIRRAVTLASSLLGDDVRTDDVIWKNSPDMDCDERLMKVRLLDKFEQAFQDSAECICSGPFAVDLRSDNLSETSATDVEFVVDDVGNIDIVAQAAAPCNAIVLTVEQRRLSTKLLSGMADGGLDASSLRTLLKLAERQDAEDATEPPKPSAPLSEPAAAVSVEPKCGIPIPPSTVQPRESAGKFGSKAKQDGNRDSAVAEQAEELVCHNAEKVETFKKEVLRVPSKDVDCTVTANAEKEYLRSSDVEAWLNDMGVKTGNKFQTQMSKLKTLKLFYDFVCKDPRMEDWRVAAHKDGGNKLLLRKNPFAIFLLKNNDVTKAQYQQLTGIGVPTDTPYAVSFEDQANLIIYWSAKKCQP
jgi:hypothetical protein